MINYAAITPVSALMGGVLIGLATTVLILFNGKIAGISGILGGVLKFNSQDVGWRLLFLVGLLSSPIMYGVLFTLPQVNLHATPKTIIVAGLLVGIGTRYGSGCTSGHGVCGLSRLSLRSLVATATFMLTGMITVFITHHII